MLPFLSAILPKWKKVRSDNFNPGKYQAHQKLQDTVRNLINNKPKLERLLMEAQHEMDDQTDAENNNPTTPGDATEIVARFGNEDEIMNPPENPIRNLNLPDSSEDVRTQNVETRNVETRNVETRNVDNIQGPMFGVGLKRPRVQNGQSEWELEPKRSKICDYCNIEELYDDYMLKKGMADEAKVKWKNARESKPCLRSPRDSQ